jgi:hypothetical protein
VRAEGVIGELEVGDSLVPIADSHDFEDLTFVATSLKAKAAVQIAGSIFLTGGLQCSATGHTDPACARLVPTKCSHSLKDCTEGICVPQIEW